MYAAKVDDSGMVTQVIVGEPAWAAERLGGVWVGCDVKPGIGWRLIDGQVVEPDPEPYGDGTLEDDLAGDT